jgi:hypothetical protein
MMAITSTVMVAILTAVLKWVISVQVDLQVARIHALKHYLKL